MGEKSFRAASRIDTMGLATDGGFPVDTYADVRHSVKKCNAQFRDFAVNLHIFFIGIEKYGSSP